MIKYVLTTTQSGERTLPKYVRIDPTSGGYPYLITDIYRAEWWDNREDAARYADMFSRSLSLFVRRAEFTVTLT